jgi:MFS family permease
VFNTLGVFIGAILGGFLSNYITVINPFFALFIISGVLRFIIPFIMWKKISEVRKVSHFNIKDGIKEQIDSIMKLLRIPI